MKLLMASLAILSILTVSFSLGSQPIGQTTTSHQPAIEIAPDQLVCRRGKAQADEGRFAGFIRAVGSRCYRQIGDTRPVLLDPKRDWGAKVFVGEKFQCFAGSMIFELNGSTAKTGATYRIRAADACQSIRLSSIADPKVAKGRKTRSTSRGGLEKRGRHHHVIFERSVLTIEKDKTFRAPGSNRLVALVDREMGNVHRLFYFQDEGHA